MQYKYFTELFIGDAHRYIKEYCKRRDSQVAVNKRHIAMNMTPMRVVS